MATTTMHFGPEWMRTKGASRPAPSPPLTTPAASSGASTYSALVAPLANTAPERPDVSNPFRYSKEEMLRIYKEGGGRGGLGLEVERWDGIVREVGYDPAGLKEMSEAEKKIFSGSLNSEIRRRQSTDVLSPLTTSSGERPKLGHAASGTASPMRDRFGNFAGRRRDSTDQAPLSLPRKLSLSSMQGALASPREGALPSPRTRIGLTPGFDGVLSESWSSRRRTSESAVKSGVDSATRKERDVTDPGNEAKGPDIKEEEEESLSQPVGGDGGSATKSPLVTQSDSFSTNATSNMPDTPKAVGGVESDVAGLTLRPSDEAPSDIGEVNGSLDSAAPKASDTTDLASIEWSYLDPQGQIQGPFRADTMQRWHDEGYFSANLLMRRTHLDSEWTSVGEMTRRAGNAPVFLTPGVTSTAPPGLPRRPDPLLEGPIPDLGRGSPFQPIPIQNLRSTTLDPYLHGGSSSSASPSSSFGVARFVNGSPDPGPLEPRTNLYTESNVGPRLAGLVSGSPMAATPRRTAFNDPFDLSPAPRSPFASTANIRMPADGLGLGAIDPMNTGSVSPASPFTTNFSATGSQRGPQETPMTNGHATPSGFAGPDLGFIGGPAAQGGGSRIANRDVFNNTTGDDALVLNGNYMNSVGSYALGGQQYPHNQTSQYSSARDSPSLNSLTPLSERPGVAAMSVNHQVQQSFVPTPVFSNPQSQWPPQSSPALRRPGPFDPDYPTTNNTIITGKSTIPQQAHNRFARTTAPNEPSQWFAPTAQGTVSSAWTGESNSLTVANLGQHNQQQLQAQLQDSDAALPIDIEDRQMEEPVLQDKQSRPTATKAVSPIATPSVVELPRPAQKSRRKSTVQLSPSTPAPQLKAPSAPVPVAKPPSPAPPVEPKPAWNTDEDNKKGKPSGATLGLREIQEVEMKKLEARKAADRERERTTRAAGAASHVEDFQPFTASWGLPTSQAGAARSTPMAKEASAPVTPTLPVWTNTSKPQVAKKGMKEIQEEERRKKQAAKEKETVAAAAKRAHAETTNKSTPPQLAGGVWTTVGVSGKVAGPAASTNKPTASTSVSSTKVVPNLSPVPTVPVPPVMARASSTSAISSRPANPPKVVSTKTDDFPAPPSQEFLKWLSESLKGLNSSVNFEEITSMLLSFPLDPDPSTVEIISDLIYASSTTLDGRRFASDFVGRRKTDAASRQRTGVPASTSVKPISIAEVVKAQPKPAQSEWGGFKVVNKKKKGGRA
ncbi:uncharacterized protein FIBRA_03363 [Fibroporia radiculosa]|uniref:GYF domain-containing protein n=1 Tax=Fibroporia radiculosa TaxID=599839 RepID=J4H2D1_9APHY|nr:uncharacterized protein FIBRA_03363 [Fibroporia radiculosa]CCM01314.1 predicted protein [Fibroporia radiculosa]